MALFNIGMTEILLLLVIAFVVVCPQDLPKVARALGRFIRYVRQTIEEIKRETGFDEVADELRGVERELKQDLKSADIRKDLKDAEREINESLKSAQQAVDAKGLEKDIKKGLGGKAS